MQEGHHQASPEWSPLAAQTIDQIVDLAAFPLDDLASAARHRLVAEAKARLGATGSFTMEGFLKPAALAQAAAEVEPMMRHDSYHHCQQHNIYFRKDALRGAPEEVQARRLTTSNWTLTCDQLIGKIIHRVYSWEPLRDFLAEVMEKPALYPMADPLAALNVMGYGPGDQIGWHFDRAEFTVTLPLQAPERGGIFRYRRNLRSAEAPNYDGVQRLLAGAEEEIRTLVVPPGSLNVFAGFRSPHCVTPIEGERLRLIAVLSFMEQQGVTFSPEDRQQFYGRSEPRTPSSV